MSTCKIICVTNRALAGADFFGQLERIASAGVESVVLREKDLDEAEYGVLAERAAEICQTYHVPLTLHTFADTALKLGIRRIHLPLPVFLQMEEAKKREFQVIGVSVHSAEEAAAAQKQGASYLTAGHVFATDCKRGLAPRGIPFLEEVCRASEIPVYAIGGIGPEKINDCLKAGAAGVCLMSSLMKTEDPKKYLGDCIFACSGLYCYEK